MGKERPDLAVGAVVLVGPDGGPATAGARADELRVLLVQRRNPPNQGAWSFPGGRVERGEPLVEAVRREVREETGLAVNVGDLVDVFEIVVPRGAARDAEWHYVILDYLATPVTAGQTPVAGDDAMDARFVWLTELARYSLSEAVERVIAKAVGRIG